MQYGYELFYVTDKKTEALGNSSVRVTTLLSMVSWAQGLESITL